MIISQSRRMAGTDSIASPAASDFCRQMPDHPPSRHVFTAPKKRTVSLDPMDRQPGLIDENSC
jgi:hypothetical protein